MHNWRLTRTSWWRSEMIHGYYTYRYWMSTLFLTIPAFGHFQGANWISRPLTCPSSTAWISHMHGLALDLPRFQHSLQMFEVDCRRKSITSDVRSLKAPKREINIWRMRSSNIRLFARTKLLIGFRVAEMYRDVPSNIAQITTSWSQHNDFT